MNAKSTKKGKTIEADALRVEYQRADLGKGTRGKYFKQHTQGTNLVLLQPEVAKAFPTPAAVNEALLGLMQVAARVAPPQQQVPADVSASAALRQKRGWSWRWV